MKHNTETIKNLATTLFMLFFYRQHLSESLALPGTNLELRAHPNDHSTASGLAPVCE